MNATLFTNGWGWTAAYTYDASNNLLLHTLTHSPSELVFPSNTSMGAHVSQTDIHSPGSVLHTVDITVDGVESVTVPAGSFSK
jgi:YD repeat-containing protein